MSPGTVQYVYGIVRAGTDTAAAPPGIGGARVQSVTYGATAALVSPLDGAEYTAGTIEERTADVEWLAPRAEAHNAVVSWAGDPGPVIPLHMWTLFRDEAAVGAMLRERSAELDAVLQRVSGADEYGLRVYADAEALARSGPDSSEVDELEAAVQSAGPGQRYLIERKLERARRDAVREAARAAADDVYETLQSRAVAAARDEIPSAGAADGSAVLSAAFLVRRGGLDDFRSAVTGAVREYEPRGFRFAFTGPWPPYHFASDQ